MAKEHRQKATVTSFLSFYSNLSSTHTNPFMMYEEILEINLPKIFALQTYMLLKERGGIQVSPLALSTCLLLTCWERLGKRSSCFA